MKKVDILDMFEKNENAEDYEMFLNKENLESVYSKSIVSGESDLII